MNIMQPEALNAEGKRNNIEYGYRLLVWPDFLKGQVRRGLRRRRHGMDGKGRKKPPPGVCVGNGWGLGLGGQL